MRAGLLVATELDRRVDQHRQRIGLRRVARVDAEPVFERERELMAAQGEHAPSGQGPVEIRCDDVDAVEERLGATEVGGVLDLDRGRQIRGRERSERVRILRVPCHVAFEASERLRGAGRLTCGTRGRAIGGRPEEDEAARREPDGDDRDDRDRTQAASAATGRSHGRRRGCTNGRHPRTSRVDSEWGGNPSVPPHSSACAVRAWSRSPGVAAARYGNAPRNGTSFAVDAVGQRVVRRLLKSGVNGVPPARARSSMSATSSTRRRPFGKPSFCPASRPSRSCCAIGVGMIDVFNRIISDGVPSVGWFRSGTPVRKIETRSSRGAGGP